MRMAHWQRAFVAAFAVLSLAGCGGASLARLVQSDAHLPRTVELTATPFHAQEQYQCGPAALATVLGASGVEVAPQELVGKVYVPELEGSLQAEMIAATRGYDRLAYRVAPTLDDLLQTVADGYPVLVLQNLGVERVPFWHYAVVVGYDAGRNHLLLRSGTKARQVMSARRFAGAWRRAQHWGVVVVRPGDIPASATPDRYLEAAAGLEAAQRLDAALAAYEAAASRWSDNSLAVLGTGNIRYRQRRLPEAEAAFRAALERDPHSAVARNNLAQVLLEANRPQEALAEIERARRSLTDQRFSAALAATESAIRTALAQAPARP